MNRVESFASLRRAWSWYAEKTNIKAPLHVGQVFLRLQDVRSLLITSSLGDYPFYFLSNIQMRFLSDEKALEFWKTFLDYLHISYSDTIYDMDEDYKLFPLGSLRKPLNNLASSLGIDREIHLSEIYRVYRFTLPPYLYMGITPYYVLLLSVKYLKSRKGIEEVPVKTREYILKLFGECVIPDVFSNLPNMQKLEYIRDEDFFNFKRLLKDLGYSALVPFVEEAEEIASKEKGEK